MATKGLKFWKQHLGLVPASVWDDLEIETLVLADSALMDVPDQIVVLLK